MFKADPNNGYWLLPSRRRPHNLDRFCKALLATQTSTPGLILIKKEEFDNPDLARGYAALNLPDKWRIVQTEGDSQGDKLREVADEYMNCDWAGLIGDDQVVQTEQWDLKIIEWLKGWNLVTCYDDGWQIHKRGPNGILGTDGRMCGTICLSGDLLRTVGYIFPPQIHHVYLDDIWEEIAVNTDCWNFASHARSDVVIAHLHQDRGMAPNDDTYNRAYSHFAQLDFEPWQEWRRSEGKEVIKRVSELRAKFSEQ